MGRLLRAYGERGMDLGIRGGDERSACVCVCICVSVCVRESERKDDSD